MRASRLTILTSLVIAILLTFPVLAKKGGNGGGNGGGKPGGEPPPPCTDKFPSFVYVREGRRNSEDVTYLASEDGCRSVPLPGVTRGFGNTVHMTDVLADGSVEGVIVWSEDPGGLNHYRMRRADFTVDIDGNVTVEVDPVPLPLEDNPVPSTDHLFYLFPDIWGDSTHDELYLVTDRGHDDNPHSYWIYDLNKLSDENVPAAEKKRELYQSAQSENVWVCPEGTLNPEAVAGCYRPIVSQWNPAGTALYIQGEINSPDQIPASEFVRWVGVIRLQIEREPLDPLDSWVISPPEIVYAGSATNTVGEPGGAIAARPEPMPGDLIPVGADANHQGMLDVELCVSLFAPVSYPAPDLWTNCLMPGFNTGDAGNGSWQSPDHILHTVREKRRKTSVLRTSIQDGVSTKLIDNAERPDTGM